jgi:serpin B
MTARKTLLGALLACGLAGCQGDAGPPLAPIDVPPEDLAAVVRGDNEFALELYAQLRGDEGNLFVSPWSISAALAMTYAGARGETAAQMKDALHLDLPPESLHPAFHAHLNTLAPVDGASYELAAANALWAQKDKAFLPEFTSTVSTHYGAEARSLDFATAPEAARQTINAWVEDKTRGRIEDLFPQGTIDPMTRLALTSAIYFKGRWKEEFDEDDTRDEPFHAEGGDVDVPFMHIKEDFGYHAAEGLQVLEMLYRGGDLSMVVLLPERGLVDLESRLTLAALEGWIAELHEREVRVALPRFRFTKATNPQAALEALGMRDAFTMAADLSGMDGTQDLYIQTIRHKAFVQVNEEGTEAAAATGVAVGLKALPEPAPVFRADRPFLFLIRQRSSGAILFMGRVMQPVEE